MALRQTSQDNLDRVSKDGPDDEILKRRILPTIVLLGFAFLFHRDILREITRYTLFLLGFMILYDAEQRKEQEREIPFAKLPKEIQDTMNSDNTPTFKLGEGEVIQTDKGTQISRDDGNIHIQ